MSKEDLYTDSFKIDETDYFIRIEDLSDKTNCINLYLGEELIYSSGLCKSTFSSLDNMLEQLVQLNDRE